MLLLSIDTCRAFLAACGIVPRHCPILGRIIYGKRDEDLIKSILVQLGYDKKESNSILRKLTNKKDEGKIKLKNPAGYLLNILAQYTAEFESEISYGSMATDKKTSYSRYYVSTMDAVHDAENLKYLTIIMANLIDRYHSKKLDFIIVPKGGNPILAQSVASQLGIDLVIAKDQNDSARPPQSGAKNDKKLLFEIRYEGVKKIVEKDKRKKVGILLDCNTSGGTQLRAIVEEFNDFINNEKCNIEPISEVFVLFKLVKKDENGKNFENLFSDIGCKLYRYFDLDESDKASLINIPEYDYYSNSENIDILLNNIKEKKHLYYE